MGARRRARRSGVIYEVFRQERKGQPFAARRLGRRRPTRRFAEVVRARAVRRGAASRPRSGSSRARRSARSTTFVDELDRNYHRVDGYSLKEKLKEARERAGTRQG